MKIPLLIESKTKTIEGITSTEKRIILPLTIVGRGIIKTKFIVDTGSSFSFINYPTFLRLNLPKGEVIVKDMIIGNTIIDLLSIRNLKLYVRSEEEKAISIITSILSVALPSEKDKGKAYELPNIIGLNFLENHGLKLFIDMKNENCYLEV
jgi:hypothetical protein